MDQISKINKVVNPDLKLFVGDSLAGNDTVNQAREFYQYTKFDGSILTKSDADARGGAAISIVKVTSTPILYLGVGQEYKDLKPFDKDSFLESLFGAEEIFTPQTQPEIKGLQQQEISMQEKTEQVKPEIKVELKQELKLEPKPVVKQEKIQVEDEEDPFAGIATKDIEKFSDLFDVQPPEIDKEAKELAARIRKWISQGRPKTEEDAKEESIEEETMEQEDAKPKKKRSLFGWGRK
jgi:fused signal recognition particle receptor